MQKLKYMLNDKISPAELIVQVKSVILKKIKDFYYEQKNINEQNLIK